MSLKVSPEARAFLHKSQSDTVVGPRLKAGIDTFFQGLQPQTPVGEKEITLFLDTVYPEKEKRSPLVKELHQWFVSKLNPNPSEPLRLIKLFSKLREERFVEKKKAATELTAPSILPRIVAVRDRASPIASALQSDRPRHEKWAVVAQGFDALSQQVRAQDAGQVQAQGRTANLEEEFSRFRAEAQEHFGRSENLNKQTQVLQEQVRALSAQLQGVLAADQGDRVRIGNVEADLVRRAAATVRDIQLAYDTAVSNRDTIEREHNRLHAEWAGLSRRETDLLATGITSTTVGGVAAVTGSIGTPIAFHFATAAGHSAHAAFYGVAGAATPALFSVAILSIPFIAIGAVLLAVRSQEDKRIEEIKEELKKVNAEFERAQELVRRWDASRNNLAVAAQPQAAAPAAQPAAAPVVQPEAAPAAQPAAAPVVQPEVAPAAQPAEVPEAQPITTPKPDRTAPKILMESDDDSI